MDRPNVRERTMSERSSGEVEHAVPTQNGVRKAEGIVPAAFLVRLPVISC